MSIIKGYKATDKNGQCKGFQFEVGKTYKTDSVVMCSKGFHFCEKFFDVFQYYPQTIETRVFEVEAFGEILKENDKSATNKLKIIRELSKNELLDFWMNKRNSGNMNSGYGNSGNRNSGYGNSGNRNSGDWNSGDGNSGNRNSGDWNSGDWNSGYGNSGNRNSGYGNSGNRNSGYRNSGDWNSGYGNSGNRNSGDWNSGDGNSGYFNTEIPVYFFNKPSNTKYTKELEYKIRALNVKPILQWIGESLMTDQEKIDNPSHKTTNGFLRKTDRMDWTKLTDSDKELIKSLPNFDNEIFMKISNGVSLESPKTIKVNHNSQEFEIDIEKAKELGIIK